ncbi:MAG: hypothetical protein WA624_13445 [Methylocella sp.]
MPRRPDRFADDRYEALARLIEILAPGNADVVAFFETYFDESDSHDGAPALCVAAYLFEKEECRALDMEWKSVLEEFDLPYFHMVDCAHHAPPFSKLSKEQCVDVEKRMIGIIRNHMLFGAAITVNEREYDGWAARREIGTAHSYCCWQTIASINSWMDESSLAGKLAYFSEAGHDSPPETGDIMNHIARDKEISVAYRYGSHTFVQKTEIRPIQTPDIFAWLHANHFKRVQKGEQRPRKDYVALIQDRPHKAFMATRDTVSEEIVHSWVR